MSNTKTFTVNGLKDGGDPSTTLYDATCDGTGIVIAAMTGQFKAGETYTWIITEAPHKYNGVDVYFLAAPSF
ncbi:hypothetical protein CPI83_29025 (plasmid) [Rhodococcus sp. H-CA8f]|uniref:Uncharacterized protein n=1 Tax=Rhodococcus baikonurensis TaxID=172041 RepID=A0ABV5XFT0_9NOCA|nr:hypothetical protein [Rhodococcus sp. H-CA8f]ATI36254.1 hypothetical protein CPI83_29025 [Rhodococcus sp. H-CA8f]